MTNPNDELVSYDELDESFDDYPDYDIENDCVLEYESD